ncbi:FtsW/RodA/SpoVE family cell cycle protein [Glaesserella parasuis]|uniref:FtsW/RodA/SpoVE family cell cycle protein n=1 Tax=Glaesserella parasuis TaxID=738 RepID=UPI001EEF347D|nr:FtsW/RodA/SpoVE family cell cycle protein [Glaesserella parasuis]
MIPDKDPLGTGYTSFNPNCYGSGGIEGKGWMEGTQSQLDFLPEPHTDFIFAVLSEEFGLIGVLVLLAIYLFIIARINDWAKSASALDEFYREEPLSYYLYMCL